MTAVRFGEASLDSVHRDPTSYERLAIFPFSGWAKPMPLDENQLEGTFALQTESSVHSNSLRRNHDTFARPMRAQFSGHLSLGSSLPDDTEPHPLPISPACVVCCTCSPVAGLCRPCHHTLDAVPLLQFRCIGAVHSKSDMF